MNLVRLGIARSFWCAVFAWGALPLSAQVITIDGHFTSPSNSSLFIPGENVEISIKYPSTLVDFAPGPPIFGGPGYFEYRGESATIKYGSTSYTTNSSDLIRIISFTSAYSDPIGTADPGRLTGIAVSVETNAAPFSYAEFELLNDQFFPVTYPNGLLLPGLPLSDFDPGWNVIEDKFALSGSWVATSYSLSGFVPVPEPSTYSLCGAVACLTLVLTSRRRGKAREKG